MDGENKFTNSTRGNSTSGDDDVSPTKNEFRQVLWVGAGISTVLCLIVSSILIRKHLQNYTRPREQRKIVGILWLAPIFAVDSFLSLSFISLTPAMDLLKEIYEGYTVYLFFSLLVEYLGGETRAIELLNQRLEPLYRPFPFNKICKGPMINDAEAFLIGCKRGVMQFVIVRPTMAVISAVLFLNGKYTKGNFALDQGYIYVELINNASVSWAVYCLVMFYVALKRPLAIHDPLPKFVAIKAVVFLSFWQQILLSILAHVHVIQEAGSWTVENVTTGLHDLLICFEMLLAAFYHRLAFPWQIYDRGRTSDITTAGFDDNFALSDARRDFATMLPSFTSKQVVAHADGSDDATDVEGVGEVTGKRKADVIIEGEQPLLREED